MAADQDALEKRLKELRKEVDKHEESRDFLEAARILRHSLYENGRRTSLLYDKAIDQLLKSGDKRRAAVVAIEAKQHSVALRLYKELRDWEEAAFVCKISGQCERARDFYLKAGNEYYAQRMQANIDGAKKSA